MLAHHKFYCMPVIALVMAEATVSPPAVLNKLEATVSKLDAKLTYALCVLMSLSPCKRV